MLVTSVLCIGVKIRIVIKALEQAGWVLVATRGSHRQFKHPGADQQPHGMSR